MTEVAHRPPPLSRSRHRLDVVDLDSPDREGVEHLIRSAFLARYRARVARMAPSLVALRDPDGNLVAAAGFRNAADGPLFLETYLPKSVERMIEAGARSRPARSSIAEVGHLAATRPGEGRRLVVMLAGHLFATGHDWVVSTLTRELRHLFHRLSIRPLVLGPALSSHLGESAKAWGSYYDHHPVVLAGHLPHILTEIGRHQPELRDEIRA